MILKNNKTFVLLASAELLWFYALYITTHAV